MSNHVKRFYAAVTVIVSHGDIKQRLISAFEDHLAEIEDEGMPVALRQTFSDLRHAMSRVDPLNGEGRIRATVRKMSITEAEHCAKLMLDLYADVIRCDDGLEDSMPLRADRKPVVPPFLIKSV